MLFSNVSLLLKFPHVRFIISNIYKTSYFCYHEICPAYGTPVISCVVPIEHVSLAKWYL
jgi:hypothetical protein